MMSNILIFHELEPFSPKNPTQTPTPHPRFGNANARIGSTVEAQKNAAKCPHLAETNVQFCGLKAGIFLISMS
jgi:hypothetical protein